MVRVGQLPARDRGVAARRDLRTRGPRGGRQRVVVLRPRVSAGHGDGGGGQHGVAVGVVADGQRDGGGGRRLGEDVPLVGLARLEEETLIDEAAVGDAVLA